MVHTSECACVGCLSVHAGFFFSREQSALSSTIDNSVSQAIRNSGKILMTKNLVFLDRAVVTILTASKFENGNTRNTVDVWLEYRFFKQQPCDFGIDKENFPENSIIYVNQGYQFVKDNKRIYCGDYFLIGQVNECANSPET